MFTYFLRKEFLFFFMFLVVLVSFFPTLKHAYSTPPNTIYTMAYNFYPDYFQFVSWMKDGAGGDIALTSRFTPEVYPRKLGHTFFSLFGFVSSIFTRDYFLSFSLARVVLGFLKLVSVYILIRLICKGRALRLLCFLCVLLLPSFYQLSMDNGVWSVRYFLPGITNFDVFRRIAFLPHHLFATILMIFGLIFYARSIERNSFRFSIGSGLLFFVASLVNPATILSMGSTLVFSFAVFFLQRHKENKRILFIHFGIVFLGIILAIIYLKFYLFTVFPWDLFFTNDVAKMQWPFLHYLGALGWVVPLGVLGILLGKKYFRTPLFVLVIAWGIAPIIAVFLSLYFPQISMFRLFQAQQAIPLGILSGIGLFGLYERFKSHLLIASIFLIIFLISVPYYFTSFQEQLNDAPPNNYYLYLPKSTYETFQFLDTNTSKESVVLAGYYSGQVLPALSHNRVLVGHMDGTFEYSKKLDLMTKFYSGNFTFSDMDTLVKENNISYFYFGSDTPPAAQTSLKHYSKSKLIYENDGNFVYEVLQ